MKLFYIDCVIFSYKTKHNELKKVEGKLIFGNHGSMDLTSDIDLNVDF